MSKLGKFSKVIRNSAQKVIVIRSVNFSGKICCAIFVMLFYLSDGVWCTSQKKEKIDKFCASNILLHKVVSMTMYESIVDCVCFAFAFCLYI